MRLQGLFGQYSDDSTECKRCQDINIEEWIPVDEPGIQPGARQTHKQADQDSYQNAAGKEFSRMFVIEPRTKGCVHMITPPQKLKYWLRETVGCKAGAVKIKGTKFDLKVVLRPD